jgi:hypothetical protein
MSSGLTSKKAFELRRAATVAAEKAAVEDQAKRTALRRLEAAATEVMAAAHRAPTDNVVVKEPMECPMSLAASAVSQPRDRSEPRPRSLFDHGERGGLRSDIAAAKV